MSLHEQFFTVPGVWFGTGKEEEPLLGIHVLWVELYQVAAVVS